MFRNWTHLNTLAICLVLLVPFMLGTKYASDIGGYREDVPHVSGDFGVLNLGVRNDDLGADLSSTDGDNTPIAVNREGAVYEIPSFGFNELGTIQLGGREDGAFTGGDAGIKILAVRNDGLSQNALVDSDGDLVRISADNFGALWVTQRNPWLEFDLQAPPLELIGINEQVAADEYSASINFFFNGSSGVIRKLCMYATQDDSGTIFTPAGTLYIWNIDPAVSAGDTSMTAIERTNIVNQYTFVAGDWDSDANGASTCKLIDDVFVNTFFFASWRSATGEVEWNSAVGDDEQLQFLMWSRTDS